MALSALWNPIQIAYNILPDSSLIKELNKICDTLTFCIYEKYHFTFGGKLFFNKGNIIKRKLKYFLFDGITM